MTSAVTASECRRLADLAQGKTVLEVGAHYGRSTIALASTAQQVFSVDWHQGDQYTKDWGFTAPDYLKNLRRYDVLNNVAAIVADARHMAPVLRDESFDVVFIDADHSLRAVTEYVELFARKAKLDGHVCFHDYNVEGCFEQQVADTYFEIDELVHTLAVCKRSTFKGSE